ncbi:heterokaryon incompatibility protein-domain-containing protein, partial [Gymnopilus junonius]
MRLLHVNKLELEEFLSEKTRPSYAILSHTWGDGEVTLQDLPRSSAKSMPGYAKIERCCEQARQDGFEYAWIDTCCIGKTSSAELSEAINSMFQWYTDAHICYVYLSDDPDDRTNNQSRFKSFSDSRWFTRGWTLQELLVPTSIVFDDCDWIELGTKNTLHLILSSIKGIPRDVPVEGKSLADICIAQRMSWAAMRQTTRAEDIAYCLLGIFGVNMLTLYGEEGQNAFIRLQHEIMKSSDDHTLFAW